MIPKPFAFKPSFESGIATLIKKLIKIIKQGKSKFDIHIVHTLCPHRCKKIEDIIKLKFKNKCRNLTYAQMYPSMGAHIGPNSIQVALWQNYDE